MALAVASLCVAPAAHTAGDPAAGRRLAVQCGTCHGIDGVARVPGVPHLAGQVPEYLALQLEAFRAGSRRNPQMDVVSKALTDQNIADLAAWYSSIKVSVEAPPR